MVIVSKKEIKQDTTIQTDRKPKTYIVETPVKEYNGEVAGVQFAYGKAEVREGWVLDWFKEKGYKVTEK